MTVPGTYETDAAFSRRWMPKVLQTLGPLVLQDVEGSELDLRYATDIIAKSTHIACRVRREKFLPHRHDFTIRYSRPSGAKTEWHKIFDLGYCRRMFYCIAPTHGIDLLVWHYLNLDRLRTIVAGSEVEDLIRIRWRKQFVPTSRCYFMACDTRRLPDPKALIATSIAKTKQGTMFQ